MRFNCYSLQGSIDYSHLIPNWSFRSSFSLVYLKLSKDHISLLSPLAEMILTVTCYQSYSCHAFSNPLKRSEWAGLKEEQVVLLVALEVADWMSRFMFTKPAVARLLQHSCSPDQDLSLAGGRVICHRAILLASRRAPTSSFTCRVAGGWGLGRDVKLNRGHTGLSERALHASAFIQAALVEFWRFGGVKPSEWKIVRGLQGW